jgi:hypothetical protein
MTAATRKHEKPEATWSAVKSAMSGFDREALLGLIKDLYGLSASNKQFVDARLGVGRDPLARCKKAIDEYVSPDVFSRRPIQIAKAKKVISDYRKAAHDAHGELDLMIHFVECGNGFTLEYGDIDEAFYDALVRMYIKAVKVTKDLPHHEGQSCRDRLRALVESSDAIGWGYHDGLCEAYSSAFPGDA